MGRERAIGRGSAEGFARVDLSALQELLTLADRGPAELAVHPAGIVDEVLEFIQRLVRSGQGFFGSSIIFVTEVFRKGGSCSAETEPPALKSSGLVGEAGEIAFRFHGRSETEGMTR